MKFKNLILNLNKAKIKDVIKSINLSGIGFVIIYKDQKFFGIITDGDLRRSLANGIELNDYIEKIVNKKPALIKNKNLSKINSLIKKKNVIFLPIIDKNKKLLDVYIKNYGFLNKRSNFFYENYFVIMAGGFGKRLWPYTKDTPKPLLKINGEPIIYKLIKDARINGFFNFIISVHYLKNKIKEFLKDGSDIDCSIKYLEEKKPLGTIGGLYKLAKNKHITKPVVVVNGDLRLSLNYNLMLNFHNQFKSDISVGVNEISNILSYGVVQNNGIRIKDLVEKPVQKTLINAGIYIINPKIFNLIPKGKTFSSVDLIKIAIRKNYKVNAFKIYEEWLDVGDKKIFKKIRYEKKS